MISWRYRGNIKSSPRYHHGILHLINDRIKTDSTSRRHCVNICIIVLSLRYRYDIVSDIVTISWRYKIDKRYRNDMKIISLRYRFDIVQILEVSVKWGNLKKSIKCYLKIQWSDFNELFLSCSPQCSLQYKKKIIEIRLVDREIIAKYDIWGMPEISWFKRRVGGQALY